MDAVKFIEERNRMCESFGAGCIGCPAYNDNENEMNCEVSVTSTMDATAQIAIVEKWSAEHQRKTRQDVFLEQWPNAKVSIDGVLDFCPLMLDKRYTCQSTDVEMRCQSCCREFWMQEVER
jgi:hypothetical protein